MADQLSLGPAGIVTGLDPQPRRRPILGEGVQVASRGAKSAPKPAATQAPSSDELNIVGDYPKPAAWTPDIEHQRAFTKPRKWAPSTVDFQAVAGPGAVVIKTDWDLLRAILSKPGQIKRLNFFSHSNSAIIGMSGAWKESEQDIYFSDSSEDYWQLRLNVDKLAPYEILSPYSGVWGLDGTADQATKVVDATAITLAAVRAKFAPDAQIWLYMCHAGANGNMLQAIADTFRVTVHGFSMPVTYVTPTNFPQSRNHKLNVVDDDDIIPQDPTIGAVANFHQLDTNRFASAKAPTLPFPASKPKSPGP